MREKFVTFGLSFTLSQVKIMAAIFLPVIAYFKRKADRNDFIENQ
jgi:hypothetical protein